MRSRSASLPAAASRRVSLTTLGRIRGRVREAPTRWLPGRRRASAAVAESHDSCALHVSTPRLPRAAVPDPDRRGAPRSRHEAPPGRSAARRSPVTPSSTASASPPRLSRPLRGRMPSPPARRRRSPRASTGTRRRWLARSTAPTSAGGTNPTVSEAAGPERPVTDDHSWQSRGRLEQLRHPLLLGRAGPRRGRAEDPPARPRARGSRTPFGTIRTSRAPSPRAEAASAAEGQSTSRARVEQRTEHPRGSARELDVRPPELQHERLARRQRRQRGRKPMRVHEIDARCGAPRRASEREDEERERECEPRPSFEIAHDAVAVREPEVREGRRRDHSRRARLRAGDPPRLGRRHRQRRPRGADRRS